MGHRSAWPCVEPHSAKHDPETQGDDYHLGLSQDLGTRRNDWCPLGLPAKLTKKGADFANKEDSHMPCAARTKQPIAPACRKTFSDPHAALVTRKLGQAK